MFFNPNVEWPGGFPYVVAAAVAANVVDHTFGLLLLCRLFPTISFEDSFERCGRCEKGFYACLLF